MSSLALVIEFTSSFKGEWLLTICDGKIERFERWCSAVFRDLERTVILKERNSIAIHDIDVHLGVDSSKLEISSLRRETRYETVHVIGFDNVWRMVDGQKRAIKRYRIDKYVEPFMKAVVTGHVDDNEELVDADDVQKYFERNAKSESRFVALRLGVMLEEVEEAIKRKRLERKNLLVQLY